MSSEKQFFIVVGEIQQCRWTSYEEQCEGNILPGCIVVIRPCNGGNEFEVHRRRSGGRPTPVLISREGGLPQDKVVAITDQEFDILLAIYDSLSRLNLHSSERLKWACRLKVGDKVQVEIDNSESRVAGVIRGSGIVRADRADYGLQFVVELMVRFQLGPIKA